MSKCGCLLQTGCCGCLETLCKAQAYYLLIVNPTIWALGRMGILSPQMIPETKPYCDAVYVAAAVIYLVGIHKRRPGLIFPVITVFRIGMIVTMIWFIIWIFSAGVDRRTFRNGVFFVIDSLVIFFFMLCARSLYRRFKERSDNRSAEEASKC